jgi:isopenicillin N synthase-like dioxygenase
MRRVRQRSAKDAPGTGGAGTAKVRFVDLVPTVDISNPGTTSLQELDRACRDHGFFLISGHGIDDVIANTFTAAQRFFDADRLVKDAVRRDGVNPLGYNDRELTKRRRDHKEVFDIVDPTQGRAKRHNRWPELDGFFEVLATHYDACSELATKTTELVFDALGVDRTQVTDDHRGDRTVSTMRLNYYTMGDPVPEEERSDLRELGDVALGHHTDLGLLTLLIQDEVGGLQAESQEHGWIDVEPRPGTIVVNIADTLQVMTNDHYRAAMHRVLPMTTRTRMSIPYFFNPSRDAIVEPLAVLADGAPLYRPFTFRTLLDAREADNYADTGAPDTQITDFRL